MKTFRDRPFLDNGNVSWRHFKTIHLARYNKLEAIGGEQAYVVQVLTNVERGMVPLCELWQRRRTKSFTFRVLDKISTRHH